MNYPCTFQLLECKVSLFEDNKFQSDDRIHSNQLELVILNMIEYIF